MNNRDEFDVWRVKWRFVRVLERLNVLKEDECDEWLLQEYRREAD